MKTIKKVYIFSAISLFAFCICSCGNNNKPTPSPTPDPKQKFEVTIVNGVIGSASSDNKYEEGSLLTAYAKVESGYAFDKWVVATETVSTANPYTFTVTKNIVLEAITKEIQTYHVTVNGGYGSGDYIKDSLVTVTPNIPQHKTFKNWTINSQVISTESSYSFVVTSDIIIDANFGDMIYSVDVKNGSANITEGVYGTEVTLTENASDTKFCTGWLINGVISSSNKFILNGNTTCEPIYEDVNLAVSIANQYKTHSEFTAPIGKMYVNDIIVDTTSKIIDPNGKVYTGKISLNESGTYKVQYSGTYGQSTVIKEVTFDSVSKVAYASTSGGVVSNIIPGGVAPSYQEGIFFALSGEEQVLTINEPIDITSASFDGAYTIAQVGFKPGDTTEPSAKTFEIKMSDVSNPMEFIIIKLEQDQNEEYRTRVSARASGQDFQTLGDAVVCNMSGRDAAEYMCNVLFDNARKQIAAGNKNNVIADLSLVEENPWQGFSSGKIILTMSAKNYVDESASYSLGYVADSRQYKVTEVGCKSYREGKTFNLFKDSTYLLDGYSADLSTSGAGYFLMSPRFSNTYTNTTVAFKITDINDENNFFYIVMEALSNSNLRISASSDGKPDPANAIGSNSYAWPNYQLNIILNTSGKYITNNNAATGNYDISGLFDSKATAVKVEMTSDADISFMFYYFGDTTNWCAD